MKSRPNLCPEGMVIYSGACHGSYITPIVFPLKASSRNTAAGAISTNAWMKRPLSLPAVMAATTPPCECPTRAMLPVCGRLRTKATAASASSISLGTVMLTKSPSLCPCPLKSKRKAPIPAFTRLSAMQLNKYSFICPVKPWQMTTTGQRSPAFNAGSCKRAASRPIEPLM